MTVIRFTRGVAGAPVLVTRRGKPFVRIAPLDTVIARWQSLGDEARYRSPYRGHGDQPA